MLITHHRAKNDISWNILTQATRGGLKQRGRAKVILTRIFVIEIPYSYADTLAHGKAGADNRAIICCLLCKTCCCRREAGEPDVDLSIRNLEAKGNVGVELARESRCAGRGAHDEVALQADPVYLCPRGLDGLDQIDSGRGFRSRGFNIVVIVCARGVSIRSSRDKIGRAGLSVLDNL